MFESKTVDVRILALDQAMKHKDKSPEDVLDLLIKSLGDKSAGVRTQGATCIGRFKGKAKRAVKPLIAALKSKDKVESYYGNFKFYSGWRAEVISALEELGSEAASAASVVREHLSDNSPSDVLSASVSFLGTMKDVDSRAKLIVLFKRKKGIDRHAKASIAKALGQIGGKEAFDVIADYALNGTVYEPRNASIWAIAEFKDKRVHGILLKILRSKGSGRSTWEWILGTAAIVAVKTKMPGAMAELARLAKDNPYSRDMCTSIARALREYSGPPEKIVPVLDALAKHKNSNVPTAAIETAKQFGTIGIDFIIRRLKDSDASVRCSAATALGKLAARKGVPGLRKALSDKNKYVREDAKEALALIVKKHGPQKNTAPPRRPRTPASPTAKPARRPAKPPAKPKNLTTEQQAKIDKRIANKLKLADMYRQAGRADLAKKKYQEIISDHPGAKGAATARQRLESMGHQ